MTRRRPGFQRQRMVNERHQTQPAPLGRGEFRHRAIGEPVDDDDAPIRLLGERFCGGRQLRGRRHRKAAGPDEMVDADAVGAEPGDQPPVIRVAAGAGFDRARNGEG